MEEGVDGLKLTTLSDLQLTKTHLLYADDVMIVLTANVENAYQMNDIFNKLKDTVG